MILKELDLFSGEDKFQVAGRKAEERMAHYLRRFFGQSAEVDILNYLRIDLAGERAQMDHLVLHRFGFVIVESKSVAGSVQIKDDGQWIRWFNKQPQGMRSPVTQAQMQLMLLKELLERGVNKKGFFDQVQMDVMVAISDSGTIQWPATGVLPEVCKADQIPARIDKRLRELGGSRREMLTPQHRRVIADFLCKVHKPLARDASKPPKQAAPDPVSAPAPTPAALTPIGVREESAPFTVGPAKACKHCGSAQLEARYGQSGTTSFASSARRTRASNLVALPAEVKDGFESKEKLSSPNARRARPARVTTRTPDLS